MGRAARLGAEQRRELWDRWRRGETLVEIGRALGRSTPNVFTLIKAQGGMAIGAAGDTLPSIAAAVWGDGSLWWMIAEANSLTGADPLIAGQVLILPAKVADLQLLAFASLDLCGPCA